MPQSKSSSTAQAAANSQIQAQIDVKAVRRQFQRRGAALADADFLYRGIEQQMIERLDVVKLAPDCIIDVGCGLGNGLLALRKRYPESFALGVDLADSVLSEAQRRLAPPSGGFLARILDQTLNRQRGLASLLLADTSNLPIARSSVDLIWSNLCLHWLADPWQVVREWHRIIRPGGLLMFSGFGVDTLRELRLDGADLMSFPDMHDIGDVLVGAGFADPVMDMSFIKLQFRDPNKLLADLHALGGNPLMSRRLGLSGSRRRQAWVDGLLRQRDSDGNICVTFEVYFGHAWCPERKRLPDGLQRIEFKPGARPN